MTTYNDPHLSETPMNTLNNLSYTDRTVKQFTTVYHTTFGKGTVVTLTPKSKDNLVMCWFPSVKCHEWELESVIIGGMGDITLTKAVPKSKAETESETLESVLRGLFNPN